MDVEIWIIETYYPLLKSQLRFVLLVMLNFLLISKKIYLARRFVKESGDNEYVTSSPVNSNFLQISQNFLNTAVF